MGESKYKEGVRVRVINPEIFIRCGYPETVESARKKMERDFEDEHGETIFKFLQTHFPFLSKNFELNMFDYSSEETQKLVNSLAREYNKNVLKFGGRERKIYTKTEDKYRNKEMVIGHGGPMIKKTGVYQPAYRTGGCGDPYEYEPAYLTDVKTHVFYPIYEPNKGIFTFIGDKIWIERENLEIID